MKTVRLKDNVVVEVIPEYALPAEKWYGAEFAAQCMEAPDEVDQHWTYDPETDTWAEPGPLEPEPEPTPKVDPVMQVYKELDAAYREGVDSV